MKILLISLLFLHCDVTTSFDSTKYVSYFLEEYTESALNLIEKGAEIFGLRLSLVKLDPVELTMDAIKNIHRWYNGEISGARATKNIIDSFASIGSGVIGTKIGAGIGASLCGPASPVCSAIGGMIGGLTGFQTGRYLMERITSSILDLPKTEALEKAYIFMGVHHSAGNSELNKAFRRLAMKYHPDKLTGSTLYFLELQLNFQIIKEDRGQSFWL